MTKNNLRGREFLVFPHCATFPQHSVEKREIHCHANIFPSNQFRVKLFSKKLIWRNFSNKIVAVKFQNFHSVDMQNVRLFCINFTICLLFFVKTFNSIPKMLGEGDGFFANCIRLKTASNLTIMMRISDTGIMQIFTKENYFLSKHF